MRFSFRFAGDEYPPFIVFKIYTHLVDGNNAKYINGKNMIKPFSSVSIIKKIFLFKNTRKFLFPQNRD